MKYKVYRDASNEWRRRLRAPNNKDIVATSGERYVNKADCLHGIELANSSISAPAVEV